ncbi:hypothetical protein [Nocardia yamanashiensis]|uniref:hypothetical protein n=1 Tax=Nocardia yamanashiensis TaxID=209247 RepID=UPI000AF0D41E|nr:hypothetical protein [Nocardia yamanashiensis]
MSNALSSVPAVHSATTSSKRPPCADDPSDWDLDVGTPETWRNAMRVCHDCPLLASCTQLVETFTARGDVPRAMIWAGVPYDNVGRIVEDLDRHRTVPIDHKRPMRIVRTGAAPARAEPAPETPRRHLVLGRSLRPTGTDF